MSFEEIIAHVKNTPVIWQTSHPNFKKRHVLSRTWTQMAKTLDADENYLKKRWKHLKDQYRKELKKVLAHTQPDQEEVEVTWHYYKELSFLRHEIFNAGKRRTEIPASEASDTDHESDSEPAAKIKKLDESPEERQDVTWQNDADYMFLMSILPSMKNLTEIQKLQFRGKVNDWLLEAYTQNTYGNEYNNDSKMYLQTAVEKRNGKADPWNVERE